MERFIKILHIGLLMASIFTVLAIGISVIAIQRQLDADLKSINLAGDQLRFAGERLNTFLDKQEERFNSPETQKAIENNLKAGTALLAYIKGLNREVTPAMVGLMESAQGAMGQVQLITEHTDQKINGEVLNAAVDAINGVKAMTKSIEASVQDLQVTSRQTIDAATKAIQDANAQINNPNIETAVAEITAAVTEVRKSTENLTASTDSLKESMSYAPAAARDTAKTIHNYGRWSWLAIAAKFGRAALGY